MSDARDRAKTLAQAALGAGAPTAWFERLYQAADGDPDGIPWADGAVDPVLAGWIARSGLAPASRVCVVGCGLGEDAAFLAASGYDVLAFDIAPTAVDWAARLRPGPRYAVADLFALPADWRGAFDLVVEHYTVQSMPPSYRAPAGPALASLVAPGGRLWVYARIRDDDAPFDEATGGPPWPLSRTELAALGGGLAVDEPAHAVTASSDPAPRVVAVWRRV
ncbi:MAG: methyltransferase domain-containing protein [Myxococcota bacterium]